MSDLTSTDRSGAYGLLDADHPPRETASLAALLLGRDREDVVGALVLDLGCGRGELSRSLIDLGAREVHGIDHCPEHIALARRSMTRCSNQSYRVADITAPLDVLVHEYDLVVAGQVLGSLGGKALRTALGLARRALRPGGRLVFGSRATEAIHLERNLRSAGLGGAGVRVRRTVGSRATRLVFELRL